MNIEMKITFLGAAHDSAKCRKILSHNILLILDLIQQQYVTELMPFFPEVTFQTISKVK